MTTLDPIAVSNAPMLRAIAAGGHPTLAALATAAGKDAKHINRDLERAVERGLIAYGDGAQTHEPALTATAREQLAMLDRAEAPASLFDAPSSPGGDLVMLRHDQIVPGHNARKLFDAGELAELADSLAERGLLQPIGVRDAEADGPRVIAFGERRWRAWGLLIERGTWPADHVEPCTLSRGDDKATRLAGLIENAQRADLTQLEYAEDYLALTEEFRMTPAQIAEATGQTSEHARRNIQWMIKVAREASEDNKQAYRASIAHHRRTREPETFTWTKLRDSVGAAAARPKPALDLTPKLAMALVEICDAAERRPVEVRGEPRYARLAAAPTGGPIQTLAFDRKPPLVTLKVCDGAAYVRPQLHASDVAKYLDEIGFGAPDDIAARRKCLFSIRAAVIGQLDASRYQDGCYVMPELNLSEEAQAAQRRQEDVARRFAEAQAPDPAAPSVLAAREGPLTDHAHSPSGEDLGEVVHQLHAAPQPSAPRAPGVDLTAAEQLLILEAAHAAKLHPVKHASGAYTGADTYGPFYHDTIANGLITKRVLQFMQTAKGTMMAVLTPAGIEAMAALGWFDASAVDLMEARKAMGLPAWDGRYATDWLNPAAVPAAAPPAAPAPLSAPHTAAEDGEAGDQAGPAAPPPSGGYQRDAFAQQILDVAREDREETQATAEAAQASADAAKVAGTMARALLDLDGAASHANSVLVATRRWLMDPAAKPPTITEVDAAIATIGEARETALEVIELAEAAAGEEG